MRNKSLRAACASLIGLIFMIGLFAMPAAVVPVGASSEMPALVIEQVLRAKDGATAASNNSFQYLLTAQDAASPLPDGADEAGWSFSITGNASRSIGLLAGDAAETAGMDEVIRFPGVGLYHYRLTQIIPSEPSAITYDAHTYEIHVKVARRDGLQIEAVWAETETGEKPDALRFVNEVPGGAVIGDPPVRIEKRIEGDEPTERDRFVFVMTPENAAYPLPEGAAGSYEVELYGAGEIEIGNIPFTEPGTYRYTVSERKDDLAGYTYDETVYEVVYRVQEAGDGTRTCDREILMQEQEAEQCTFTNLYHETDASQQRGSGSTDPAVHTRAAGRNADSTAVRKTAGKKTTSPVRTGDETDLLHFVIVIFCAVVALITAVRMRLFKRP